MKHLLLLLFFGNMMYAQTVTTFFSDENADVDDAMAFDTDGNLYGSNFNGSTVYKITPDGTATPFIEDLANPNGMAFDANGNFYLCEYSAGTINKYTSDGALIETFIVDGVPSGMIKDFDTDAMIFTNVVNNSVNRLEIDGTITELIQDEVLNAPVGLTFDDAGILYIGNFVGRQIYRFTTELEYVATVPDNGAMSGFDALGFITWANGMIYGTNFGGHQVYRINPNAVDDVVLLVGSEQGDTDGPLESATLNNPNGIIYNATEDALYVSEYSGMGNIRVINDFILNAPDVSSEIAFSMYPNPVTDFVYILNRDHVLLEDPLLCVYDLEGRLIESLEITAQHSSENSKLDLSSLAAGVYLVTLRNENRLLLSEKLIKN